MATLTHPCLSQRISQPWPDDDQPTGGHFELEHGGIISSFQYVPPLALDLNESSIMSHCTNCSYPLSPHAVPRPSNAWPTPLKLEWKERQLCMRAAHLWGMSWQCVSGSICSYCLPPTSAILFSLSFIHWPRFRPRLSTSYSSPAGSCSCTHLAQLLGTLWPRVGILCQCGQSSRCILEMACLQAETRSA